MSGKEGKEKHEKDGNNDGRAGWLQGMERKEKDEESRNTDGRQACFRARSVRGRSLLLACGHTRCYWSRRSTPSN